MATPRLDEISRTIGNIETRIEALDERLVESRRVNDKRHEENKSVLVEMNKSLASLASDRRVAMVVISMITAFLMWLVGWMVTPILTKLGWK